MSEIDYLILQIAGFVIPATLLVIIALGLNLQWGHTGLFNAGVAAFVGVGAYTFAMLTTGRFNDPVSSWSHWGPPTPWDLIPAVGVAMLVSASLGVLIAIPTLRLKADYLAIATLALAEIIRLVIKNERTLTGGDQTINYIPRPFGGFVPPGWASDGVFVLVAAAIAVGALVAMEFLVRLPWGRALRAIREDEESAMAVGKNPFRLKLGSIAIGCAVMGLAGALTASYGGSVHPDSFPPFLTFTAYVVVILGGSGNPRGVVLGGYVFYLFTWTTQQLRVYVQGISDILALRLDFINQMVIGLVLILFILFRPEGIVPEPKYIPKRRR